ncbi:MAG: glycosyltransferase [Clostridia bacterium]|nr:glycosyltransferase [Clostridia bacterium]
MKVLQINAVYGTGSTGVIMQDIHNLCLNEGIDSYAAYSHSPISKDDIVGGYAIGSTIGKKIHALFARLNGMQGYFSRFSTYRFLSYVKKLNPDIVQLHNLHSNYIHLNMLLKFLAKENKKTVIILHDCWFYTGGCFHYTSSGCDKWLKSCGNCPKKKSHINSHFLDRSAKVLKDRKKYLSAIKDLTVVGVSDWIAEEAKKTFLQSKCVLTIHNGVDMDVFKPTNSDFKEKAGIKNKFVILGLASKFLSPINKETFEKVTASLAEDEVLLLLGCEEEQMQNLPERVLPMPFVTDRDMLCKIYSAADVFVNCTREESLSLVNVEAQACGTPTITYCNTGAKETVDNICGFSVESGNADELIKKIQFVKEKGKNSLSDKCIEWVKMNFEKNKNYKSYLNIFNDSV